MEGSVAPYSSAMAPSGSYILIIVSQPVTENDKETILDRLNKDLLSWDVESTGCDLNGLETVCSSISPKHLDDTDVLIQHSTESLGVEVLVNPTVSTLKQCVKNFLSTSTGHKHLIHTGYTFAGSGSWILQNGTFSFDDFLEIFQQADVQSQKRCNINIHCSEVGRWNKNSFAKDIFVKVANVAFNPPERVQRVPGSEHLIDCLKKVLNSQDLEEMMEASSLVGNIRFNRPTLYMFPAGQGDCALFGINGFNMLIDGGFNRKPCSWEFIRHLDRLDAVLVTRLCENNVCGMSTLMKRKSMNNTYPQIGYVFCNIPENKTPSPKEETPKDNLIVSVVNEGHNFIQTLNELKLKPHQCWRDLATEPFVLYHKVGHGTLEMHVLSPPKDSKEMKDFIQEWSSFKETFSSAKSGLKGKGLDNVIPLSHATSVCAVLIWRPADPKDTITRILFPGSAPQNKIFESLEKLKTLDVLSHPVVTKASLSVVTKTVSHKVEKSVSRTTVPNRKITASPALSIASGASRNGDIGGHKTETKKVVKDTIKKDIKKDVKKESVFKEKKEVKTDVTKKDAAKKDLAPKEVKKEVKKIIKKEVKDLKSGTEKKTEIKNAIKKETTAASKTLEVKKTATTALKKTPATAKKDVKQTTATKSVEVRKSAPAKISEPKTTKDIISKKISDTKATTKPKPKSATSTPKSATPKTKPVAVPKPGGKMTKAVAASSIVASAVAVTAAALELNEKKEKIVIEPEADMLKEPEIEIPVEAKDMDTIEKPEEEVVVSPLPPEALSPTPSDSVSLTPSDTLSSAPLETVSPTPPLANELISTEEKEVNVMKDIEQDMPYETEMIDEVVDDEMNNENLGKENEEDVNEIEAQLARFQQNSDAMSTSFVSSKNVEDIEIEQEPLPVEASPFETQAVPPEDQLGVIEKPMEREEGYIIESREADVDDQLAQMSMEGSFCAGGNYEREDLEFATHEDDKGGVEHSEEELEAPLETMYDNVQQEELKYEEKESFSQNYENVNAEDNEIKSAEACNENVDTTERTIDNSTDFHDEKQETEGFSSKAFETELQNNENDFETRDLTEVQEKEIMSKVPEYESLPEPKELDAQSFEEQYDQQPELEALKETINRAANEDYEISRDIINDADMQETSVDEPEEIIRKESAVSITLNDEEMEDNYLSEMRRKSGTESEDDVDLHQYMLNKEKDTLDHEKLTASQEHDSDNEDVVKSPTPHAVVDYEEHMDNLITGKKEFSDVDNREIIDDREVYPSEKQYFDEKDHDSTEDQDVDDGEMIRHPTPPEMKYSEDEMRDPIGPHFITTPGLKSQGTDITEQPLYEEAEDEESDRSESPVVVEQPVFGSAIEADFPELVTVSGGTTPSEPQSPKAGFDTKKFAAETGIMEALSEHDLSESSTHSPLCHDSTSFDLPVVADKLQTETQNEVKYEKVEDLHNQEKQNIADQEKEHEYHEDSNKLEYSSSDKESAIPSHAPQTICDAPSDDESYSQNEKSETRSEKSDDDDEKSNTRHDDKSDMHDDKSDNQYDGKSDVMDDERRSDIHEDDRTDSHHDDKHDHYEDKRSGGPQDFQEDENLDYETSYHNESRSVSYQHTEFTSKYQFEDTEAGIGNVSNYGTSDMLNREDFSDKFQTNDFQQPDNVQFNDEEISRFKADQFDIPREQEKQNDYKQIVDEDKYNVPFGFHSEEKPYIPDISDNALLSDYSKVCDETESSPINDSLQLAKEDMGREITTPKMSEHSSEMDRDTDIQYDVKDSLQQENDTDMQYSNQDPIHSEFNVLSSQENEYLSEHNKNTDIQYNINDLEQSDYEAINRDKDEYMREQHEDTDIHYGIPDTLHSDYSTLNLEKSEYSLEQNKCIEEEFNKSAIHETFEYSTPESKNMEILDTKSETILSENIDSSEIKFGGLSSIGVQEDYKISSLLETAQLEETNFVSQESELLTTTQHFDASSYNYENAPCEKFEPMCSETSNIQGIESTEYGSVLSDASATKFSNVVSDFDKESIEISQTDLQEIAAYEKDHAEEVYSGDLKSAYYEEMESSEEDKGSEVDGGLPLKTDESSYNRVNGKEQTSWGHSSDYAEQYSAQTHQLQNTGYSISQQESGYIINSRFHSDSPEDNVMRSDSSPDVPYPPSSLEPLKHAIEDESKNFIQAKEEYINLNLPKPGEEPTSPNNKSHNANRDEPYCESSEEDDSSSVPGTVSPYAYTNKAYAKEEEDIDGNHIYKASAFEKSSEIIKQVEFDGNNPQSMTTQPVNYSQTYQEREYTGNTNYDFNLEEWEKPMGLPTPPDSTKTVLKKSEKPPSKSLGKSVADSNGKSFSPSVASKMSSPLKKPKPKTTKESSSTPVYVDLAYVPHHGDPHYCDVEFFKKIRARYYVFSGINPSKEVLNALLEAKKTWKEEMEVTIIPTYETDTLGYWMAQNQDDLATYSIEVAPSASRCTVNLQDHETSCAAYRLEF